MRLCLLLTFGALTLAVQSENMDPIDLDWVLNVVGSDDDESDLKLNLKLGSEGESGFYITNKGEEKKIDSVFNLNPVNVVQNIYCKTEDNKKGICVLYYRCDPKTNAIVYDETTIPDMNPNVCPHYLEVCCKESDIENDLNSSGKSEVGASSTSRYDTLDSTETFQLPVTTPGQKSKRAECGWSNPGAGHRLRSLDMDVNSSDAQYGDFPWMVALLKKTSDAVWSDANYLGGGTLIHPSVVITIARRLYNQITRRQAEASQLKCRAGEWDTQTTMEHFPHQDRDVAKYIVHKNHYGATVLNNVALLIMKELFDLVNDADHMGTGCLATSLPPDGYSCYSMGWGRDFNKKENTLFSVLKKVPLHFVDHDKCEKKLSITRFGNTFKLHNSLTCAAGEEGVDTSTCRGNGGSSLVCPVTTKAGERRYAVYGMVATGIAGCGSPEVPGVYVNIPYLKSWVDEKMQEEGFDTSYYTI